jgi:hypothetical protein
MESLNSSLALRLCALAKLHTGGAGAITESIGYSSSNLMSVVAGRRRMPSDVIDRLSEALSFNDAGFSNNGIIESWLARKIDDLMHLRELGFDFSVLCRLTTNRETNNPTAVLYKYALLRVRYEHTHKNVVLRMTRNGIDQLLSHPIIQKHHLNSHPPEGLPSFRYLDFGKLKQLRVVPPQSIVSSAQEQLSQAEIRLLVSFIHDTVTVDEAPGAQGTSLAVASEKVKRHRQYANVIKDAYNLRGSRKPHVAHGISNRGTALSVEIHLIFAGETHEKVEPAKTANDHLIVLLEHASGVIEVLFEGPRRMVCPEVPASAEEGKPSGKARLVNVAELRALNAAVTTADRLSPLPVAAME